MSFEDASTQTCETERDRDLIRVDFAQDKLGIAAALRQAFSAAAHDKSSHDFDQLLRELH
jgi:hypothetical protein